MGILNVTPDSFSDGGRFLDPGYAVDHALSLIDEGADLLDVGGESTRPGAREVDAGDEVARLIPVVRRLRNEIRVPISVDTRKAVVARAVLDEGVDIINDVSGLQDPEMAGVIADRGAGAVLMHMRGSPETMQSMATYGDVVSEVRLELGDVLDRALSAGVPPGAVVVDPGIGFAKTPEQSVLLLRGLGSLGSLGAPILVGPSRKSFLGWMLGGRAPEQRIFGTVAACLSALRNGARIFRVHDVRAVHDALMVAELLSDDRVPVSW